MSFKRNAIYLAAVALLITALLTVGRAQNPQQPGGAPAPAAPATPNLATRPLQPGQPGTIRSTVDLVQVDVAVNGRDGKPLKGLKQEQFTLSEDGH